MMNVRFVRLLAVVRLIVVFCDDREQGFCRWIGRDALRDSVQALADVSALGKKSSIAR